MEIFRKDYSAGLCPGDDLFNGRDNALLRMDNLWLDTIGAVELTRGTARIGRSLGNNPPILYIYSKILGTRKWRFVHSSDGTIYASYTDFSSGQLILAGGSIHAAFGQGFGQVFAVSGTIKKRFNSTTTYNLGIAAPAIAPHVANNGGDTGFLFNSSFSLFNAELFNQAIVASAVTSVDGPQGNYTYIQVNVEETSDYVAMSPGGPPSDIVSASGSVFVTPDPTTTPGENVNYYYFYRFGGTLDTYYFIGKVAVGGVFEDTTSDADLIQTGITLNQFLASVHNIPDEILGIAGPINGRMVYITYKYVYISDLFDPDAYDTRMVIKVSGNVGEKNLFVAKVSSSVILLGTTADIYELSGTFVQLPDGTFDANLRPYGVNQPPINEAFDVADNNLFYFASDCVRVISGATSSPLSRELDWLYKGYNCYGAPGFNIQGANQIGYRVQINKNKVYCLFYEIGGTASVYVYDLSRKFWYRYYTNPAVILTEEDGVLIAGYSDGILRQLDVNYFYDTSIHLQSIAFVTTLSKDLPNQRKDCYVLKLHVDTGGSTIDVYVGNEAGTAFLIGTASSNGVSEIVFTLNTRAIFSGTPTPVYLSKRFNLYITDHVTISGGFTFNASQFNTNQFTFSKVAGGVTYFKLVDWSIEYDARPMPTTYLRIPPSSYGIGGRKRFADIPFEIDTLGNNINAVVINGVDGFVTGQLINCSGKQTIRLTSGSEMIEQDIGLLLSSPTGQVFEFYGMIPPRTIEQMPDITNLFRTPTTNLGTACRKRISTVAFIFNSFGSNVNVELFVDTVSVGVQVLNTSQRATALYTLTSDTVGIDIYATISGSVEYYGIDLEESVTEKIPIQQKYLKIPGSNFGIAAKKRIRTVPFVINTFGHDVTVTPVVDLVAGTAETVNSNGKGTVFYYFNTDSFGVDYGLILSGASVFEFYELLKPEDVETLPVGKTFDQIGPVEFEKIGQLLEFRFRAVCVGTSMNYRVYMNDTVAVSGVFTTIANVDKTYAVKMPKGVIGNVCRIEFFDASQQVFYRWKCQLRVSLGGIKTEMKFFNL